MLISFRGKERKGGEERIRKERERGVAPPTRVGLASRLAKQQRAIIIIIKEFFNQIT